MKGGSGEDVAVLSELEGEVWVGRGRPCSWEQVDGGKTVTGMPAWKLSRQSNLRTAVRRGLVKDGDS